MGALAETYAALAAQAAEGQSGKLNGPEVLSKAAMCRSAQAVTETAGQRQRTTTARVAAEIAQVAFFDDVGRAPEPGFGVRVVRDKASEKARGKRQRQIKRQEAAALRAVTALPLTGPRPAAVSAVMPTMESAAVPAVMTILPAVVQSENLVEARDVELP